MNAKNLILSLFSAVCAGCASKDPGAPETAAAASLAPSSPQSDGAVVAALPESSIPRGACGMVLWTLDEDRPMPIFRYISGKVASMVIGGKERKFALVEASGASSYGVSERQKFVNDSGLSVTVETRFSLGFDGGSYLERGIVSIVTAEGWKTVIPSAGLAGCRA